MKPIGFAMILASACGLSACDHAPERLANMDEAAATASDAAGTSSGVDT